MTANIFAQNNATQTNSSRQLSGTAQLTNFASSLAHNIIASYLEPADADENQKAIWLQTVQKSMTDAATMDEMIAERDTEIRETTAWLKELSDDALDKMLKSQQSKRSRCKSKDMTQDNYSAMMCAAIAEYAIRAAANKPKGASSTARRGKRYTDEEIQALANDQVALTKAIRNIQSKKSIMKSKAGFDESATEYQELLEDEEKLKAVRIGKGHVDRTKQAISQLLVDVDIDKLKAGEAKEMLAQILGLTADASANAQEDDAE